MKTGSIYDNPFCVLNIQRGIEARAAGLTPAEQIAAMDEGLARRISIRETNRNYLGIENADAADIRDAIMPACAGQMELLGKMLTGSQAKTAYALRLNAEKMIADGGLESTGFLTVSVGDCRTCEEIGCFGAAIGCKKQFHFVPVTDAAEASRRINNLNRKILPDLFERAIIVTERHKSTGIHFHILGTLRGRPDIRTGLDFTAVKKRDYRSVSPALRNIWEFLRGTLPKYGFGPRVELLPVKKTGEAVACYVSKYIEKNICNRTPDDAHKKLVRYLGWDKKQIKPNEFSWASPRACAWRAKTRQVAALANVTSREEAAEAFGPRWAHDLSRLWMTLFGDATSDFLIQDGKNECGEPKFKYQRPKFDWTYPERQFLKSELSTLAQKWMLRKEAERYQFSEETREMRKMWPENATSQLRQPENQRN